MKRKLHILITINVIVTVVIIYNLVHQAIHKIIRRAGGKYADPDLCGLFTFYHFLNSM